ncbi:Stc1 domain-containing protein [Phyllosticta citribraziliensis]
MKKLRNFSQKRLHDAQRKMRAGSPPTTICIPCTGGPAQELQCFGCDVWKDLEDFSKSQRKAPDTAKCSSCIKEQVELEPVDSSAQWDDSSDCEI